MSYKTVLQMPSLAFAIISEGSSSESSGSKKRKQKYQKQAAAVWNYSWQIWIERNRKDIWRIYHNSPAFSSVAPWKTKLRILKWCLRCCLADYFSAWVERFGLTGRTAVSERMMRKRKVGAMMVVLRSVIGPQMNQVRQERKAQLTCCTRTLMLDAAGAQLLVLYRQLTQGVS